MTESVLEPIDQVKALLRNLKASRGDLAARRLAMEQSGARTPLPEQVSVTEEVLAGVRALRLSTPSAVNTRHVLYVHGGAYVAGSAQSYRMFGSRIAVGLDAVVHVLDYRLAPEHPFPAAVLDTEAAYGALVKEYPDAKIAVVGDSAGAGAAIAAIVRVLGEGGEAPAALACISPYTDMRLDSRSHRERAERDPFLTTVNLRADAELYLQGASPTDPSASPILADLSGLPPTLVQVGTEEIIYDDSADFARLAREQGVEVEFREWEGMVHVWHAFAAILPEAREAIAEMIGFLRARL